VRRPAPQAAAEPAPLPMGLRVVKSADWTRCCALQSQQLQLAVLFLPALPGNRAARHAQPGKPGQEVNRTAAELRGRCSRSRSNNRLACFLCRLGPPLAIEGELQHRFRRHRDDGGAETGGLVIAWSPAVSCRSDAVPPPAQNRPRPWVLRCSTTNRLVWRRLRRPAGRPFASDPSGSRHEGSASTATCRGRSQVNVHPLSAQRRRRIWHWEDR